MKIINKGLETYPTNRKCQNKKCITKLNHFHKGDFCYAHEGTMTEQEMHQALYALASAHTEQSIRKPYRFNIPKSARRYS